MNVELLAVIIHSELNLEFVSDEIWAFLIAAAKYLFILKKCGNYFYTVYVVHKFGLQAHLSRKKKNFVYRMRRNHSS